MRDRYPSITNLPIHLEKQQPVYFHEDTPIQEALARAEVTELIAFSQYNS